MLRPFQLALAAVVLAASLAASLGAGCMGGDGVSDAPPAVPLPPARCAALDPVSPAARRNVVLVVVDGLRRGRMGAYGGPAHTPRFDAFAADGVAFTEAWSQAPWSKPSVATIFTGLAPSRHGALTHPEGRRGTRGTPEGSDILAAKHVTLAESLAAAGYQTAAFETNDWLERRFGFAQGFEVWDEAFARGAGDDSLARGTTPGELVSRAALGWLDRRAGDPRPYFLYLHYLDPRPPYHRVPPARLAERRAALAADTRPVSPHVAEEIAAIAKDTQNDPLVEAGLAPNIALFELVYDIGVEHFDRALGELLDGLAERPGWEDTALVVTSSHGTALFERGYREDGRGLHAQDLAVPLALRLPGVATRGALSCPVGLVDLRPTLCEYLGVECADGSGGRSLFAASAAEPERIVASEALRSRPGSRVARDGRATLLLELHPSETGQGARSAISFYDRETDPDEMHDLSGDVPEPLRARFERLRNAVESGRTQGRAAR